MADLEITRAGVVVPVRVDPAGRRGPTRGQARGKAWRRSSTALFVPISIDQGHPWQRTVEAVAGSPANAAATGRAGLCWTGARWFTGSDDRRAPLPVPVALGDSNWVAKRDGVLFTNDWLFDDDVIAVDGLPVTVAERCVAHEVRRSRSLERAVQVVDMATAHDLVDLAGLAGYAERLAGREGTPLLRRAVALADENAWSPMESTMRLRWQEAGHPRPLCNAPVFDAHGRHLLTPDLLDPAAGVAGEYDGVVHLGGGQRRTDLDRDALYRHLGIEPVTMMSSDLRDVRAFVRRLDAAYRRASRRGLCGGWTLAQPDWWVDTATVAARRALDDRERSRWLRRRSS